MVPEVDQPGVGSQHPGPGASFTDLLKDPAPGLGPLQAPAPAPFRLGVCEPWVSRPLGSPSSHQHGWTRTRAHAHTHTRAHTPPTTCATAWPRSLLLNNPASRRESCRLGDSCLANRKQAHFPCPLKDEWFSHLAVRRGGSAKRACVDSRAAFRACQAPGHLC